MWDSMSYGVMELWSYGVMDWINNKKSDNQFAMYNMPDPISGFAPDEFKSKAGKIICFDLQNRIM